MGSVVLAGATSGSTTITPTDAVTATVTLPSTGGTLQTSGSGFTTNGVAYASSTSALATGSALTFDGTNLILGSANPNFQGSSSTGSATLINNSGGAYVRVYGGSHATKANYTEFINASSTTTIDSAGNLGLGVTPSSWDSTFKALESGSGSTNGGAFYVQNNGDYTAAIATNLYYNSGFKYKNTASSGRYEVYQNTHKWYSAPSGTSGTAISFTNIANLDTNSLYVYVGINPSSNGATNAKIFNSSSGSGTATLYVGNQTINTSSDIRLKENVVDTQRNALELLGQLRVVDHTWNDPSDQCENNRNSRGSWMGLIAQEAQPIIPWLVNKPTADVDEKGDPQYWHMDYGYSVPLLVKAIQELSTLITAQQSTIQSLTERITALEGART